MFSQPTAWLMCKISQGMFPDEYVVEIEKNSHQKISLFAEKSDLKDIDLEHHSGYLKVRLLDKQSENGEQLVFLPSEALEQGNRWLYVQPSKLINC